MTKRNPHMQGVTSALRLAVGRVPGADRDGEWLEVVGEELPVHLFDAFAMTNLRLCSAYKVGATDSRGTGVMSRNCLRHLAETVRILEPMLCIVQGTKVNDHLSAITAERQEIGPLLHRGTVAGAATVVATFTHPSARGEQRWGGLTNVPYLHESVTPTLKAARRILVDSADIPPKAMDMSPVSSENRPARRPTLRQGEPPTAAAMNTREVAAFARQILIDEITRRGGRAVEFRVGQRTELRVHGGDSRLREIRVLSRRAGDWQTSIREGDAAATRSNRFWILVDLVGPSPEFYVVPEDWMVRDIRREHDEYLARHGGRRALTPGSLHHRVQSSRVRAWRARWDLLGLSSGSR